MRQNHGMRMSEVIDILTNEMKANRMLYECFVEQEDAIRYRKKADALEIAINTIRL